MKGKLNIESIGELNRDEDRRSSMKNKRRAAKSFLSVDRLNKPDKLCGSSTRTATSPHFFVVSIHIYIYIYTTDDNRQKLTAERAAIVGRGVETVNSHCTKHNVLLRCFDSFLRQNPIPVPFDPRPLVPSPLSALLRC